MKTKVIIGIVSVLFLATMLVTSVAAQVWVPPIPWQPEQATFSGYGWCICDDEYTPPSTWGDRCYFRVSGEKTGDTWRGRGFWVDVDWYEGVLWAVFTVKDGCLAHDPNPGHITEIFNLWGKAAVFIDGLYKGTYGFGLELADADAGVTPPGTAGGQPDWIGLRLWDQFGNEYYWTGHPRVKGGDIATWWYPEFPG